MGIMTKEQKEIMLDVLEKWGDDAEGLCTRYTGQSRLVPSGDDEDPHMEGWG